jgi:hypothetical protein
VNVRLDRIGRILVMVGGIAVAIALSVPAIGRVVCFGLGDASCTAEGAGVVMLAALFTVVVAALVVMTIRGGSGWLLLAAIGGLAVAANSALDLPGIMSGEDLLVILGELAVVLSGSVLAVGAAIRLVARRARGVTPVNN